MTIEFIITLSLSALACVGAMWPLYNYVIQRRRENNLKEFENYHKLIKELVQPDDSKCMYVDRQTAIIYEMRNFKRYYSFSYRTLLGLKEKWVNVPDQYPRLVEEIDITIAFLKKKLK